MKIKITLYSVFVVVLGFALSVAISIQALDNVSGKEDVQEALETIVAKMCFAMIGMVAVLIIGILVIVNLSKETAAVAPKGKSLSCLTGIYLSMYHIDIKKDKIEVIKNDPNIAAPDETSARDALSQIASDITAAEYRIRLADFVDLGTLSDRIKGIRTLSFEFMSIHFGWCRARFIVENEIADDANQIIFTVESIEDEKKRTKELIDATEMDKLTGVRNKKSGKRDIEERLNGKRAGMLFVMDVDKLKNINDSFSYSVGDKVIVEVVNALSSTFREKDIIVRIEGGTFAVYIDGVKDEATGRLAADRFFTSINSIDVTELKGRAVTVSAGAVFYDGISQAAFDEMYEKAAQMLHQSKQMAGNYCSYYREMSEA